MWMECRRATGTSGEVRQLSSSREALGSLLDLALQGRGMRSGTVTLEARDVLEKRDQKFEVRFEIL